MKEWETLTVCSDCLYTAANGAPDWEGYGESGHAERYAQATERHGVGLVAECSRDDHATDWQEADRECRGGGFSWHPCEWCGDTLGGDRFCASVEVTA